MSSKTLLILFTSIALYPFTVVAENEATSPDAIVVEGESTPSSDTGFTSPSTQITEVAENEATSLDAIVVEGESEPVFDTHYTSPSTRITDIEVEGINASSIEDFVKYEPSLVVRRRYIGDSNGVVGMRGSNMFQTGRTLVYADGLPLHYLLETRWSGAPRWGLVAADETKAVEVVYGPFSAEYSGNSMGGVINIETKMPTERQFHAEVGGFAQDFQYMGADDTYTGHREFVSYGDKYENLSVYLFHNHLDNDGQPQTFRSRNISGGGGTVVSGAFLDKNSVGTDVVYVGDTGPAKSVTDLTKLKMGYEFGDWLARFTLAYEDRDWETRPTNYLVNGAGTPVWSGNATFNGNNFNIRPSHFAVSDQNRQTLLIGGGLEGPLGTSGWNLGADFSYFDVLDDQTLSSDRNPADPAYTTDGAVKEYDDTGWITLDLKARTDQFLNRRDMSFVTGYHYDHYSLKVHNYDSPNYVSAVKGDRTTSTGGDTTTHALFAQWGWDFAPQWDLALGVRYERWKTHDGFYYRYGGDMEDYADRTKDGFSPKFSLGFKPDNPWKFRYSLAKAYRFPIVEELFNNEESIDNTGIADAHLKPEIGIHHNLMAEREIPRGFVRVNLYHEVVDDVIWNQTDVTVTPTVSTFLPVSEVTTSGIEFVVQQKRVLESDVDIRFNVAYTDSEITKNKADPGVEGNVFPRMPKWRANMFATWHLNSRWDTSLGVRYASDSYGRHDNTDNTDQVYGAQDKYLFVDLNANYKISDGVKVSFGVDNLTDEVAFVAHPWPQRTFYLQGSINY